MKNTSHDKFLSISKSIYFVLFLFPGCADVVPGIENVLDDYVRDDAVCAIIHRDAIKEDTDVIIQIAVTNNGEIPKAKIETKNR